MEVVVVVIRIPEVKIRVLERGALQVAAVVGTDGVAVGLRLLRLADPNVPAP